MKEIGGLMIRMKKHFIGIHFTAYTKLPQMEYFNEHAEKLRLNVLKREKRWIPEGVFIAHKEKGQYEIKDLTTDSNETDKQKLEMEPTDKLCKPQGTTISNNETSFATLTQSPCEEIP